MRHILKILIRALLSLFESRFEIRDFRSQFRKLITVVRQEKAFLGNPS